jgi:GT2 family glycosyltransferase
MREERADLMQNVTGGARGPVVVIPLYKGPELVARLADAFLAMADELRALDAEIVFVNDSPDHALLADALRVQMPRLSSTLDVTVLTNPQNLGFVYSANRGMARARDAGRDVLLLNSDTVPRPGAFAEMVAVSRHDPMIGSVCPRSDNATVCDSPYLDSLRLGDTERAYAAHIIIARHLPRYTYVPTSVGFCVLIRWLMLAEFGLFDEIYGRGYNEETDFVRRFNRRGYRAVLANHAYVHHDGSVSFSRSSVPTIEHDEVNRTTLFDRYPEAPKLIQRYFEGPEYEAQRLLAGFVPGSDGRLRVLFDCRKLGLYHSGTHEHVSALLRAFTARHGHSFDCHVVCEAEAFRFHGLDSVEGLAFCPEDQATTQPFAAMFRIGQPFELGDLALLQAAAPVTGVLMLDTIAMDCQQLDESNLDLVWQWMAGAVDLIGFNSQFSADQFARRFTVPERVRQFVALCSTDVRDYADPAPHVESGPILVVGNHFPHKHVAETVARLREADPACSIVVLGVQVDVPGVECHVSGLLSEDLVDSLYARAAVIVLPSHYEGFGLPILHGLARERPVIARDLPSAREIAEHCPQADNLHLCMTTHEMVMLALDPPAWRDTTGAAEPYSWGNAADTIAQTLRDAIETFDFKTCRTRLARLRVELVRNDLSETQEKMGGLPKPGQGFMLGTMLAETMRSTARPPFLDGMRNAIGFRAGPEYDVSDYPVATLDDPRRLRLTANDASLDLVSLQRQILFWLVPLRLGGRLRLRIAEAVLADRPHEPSLAARLLLLGCGASADSLDHGRGVFTIHGTKRHDWKAMLPGPEQDRHFAHYLYRQMLGRHPDQDGGAHLVRVLGEGADREELLGGFLCSGERMALMGRQLARIMKT